MNDAEATTIELEPGHITALAALMEQYPWQATLSWESVAGIRVLVVELTANDDQRDPSGHRFLIVARFDNEPGGRGLHRAYETVQVL